LHERCDAFAAALQAQHGGTPKLIGIMCRNHRGFVEALAAAHRVGADVLLLNTSFAGPALAEVVAREGVDVVIYDQEFTDTVDRALAERPDATRILGWAEKPSTAKVLSVEGLTDTHVGQRPRPADRKSKLILLTSGTTGTPKGAQPSTGGGPNELKAVLDRIPWRAEQATVIMAPMFHAWGFSQLVFSALMACTIVTQRKFDPEATLQLVDSHHATGLVVVPVMFDRIMELPDEVLDRYPCQPLRFAAASGSRMRPDVVVAFMDRFGDVIYNNYNATEAGTVATATPSDLRPPPTPPENRCRARRFAFLTTQAPKWRPARPVRSSCAASPCSTGTPPGRARRFATGTWHRATSGSSMTPDGCSWWDATTR
jgi:acyl-CoA synthetase (AMP-forming)/AMP-acid ligase II